MTTEQALKRLPEVDPRWRTLTDGDGNLKSVTLYGESVCPTLWIDEDGEVQGGHGFWWLLTEMQEHWRALHEVRVPAKDQAAYNILFALSNKGTMDLTPELILSTYVNWREVLVKVESV